MSESNVNWPLLIALQQKAEEAANLNELAFHVTNESWHLVHYRLSALFLLDPFGRPQLQAISGLISAIEDTPFTLWLRDLASALLNDAPVPQLRRLTSEILPPSLREGWGEWFPKYGLWLPLVAPGGRLVGVVLQVRDENWEDEELGLLSLLHGHYAYCLNTFRSRRTTLAEWWKQQKKQPRRLKIAAAVVAFFLLFPVHLSVLAPAEIVALNADAIAAPTDGVVKIFHVRPNQSVKAGEPLFSLDDTTLRNRRDIAAQGLEVARADALLAGQKAFDSLQSKGDLATLQGKVKEKMAEVAYLDELLGRIDVTAPHDGIFVYGDPNDWIGRPVQTGERVGQLAQPAPLGVMVWVPVADAIALEPGADMRVYLQVSPLNALSGELIETSYQATLSHESIASYRIRGKLAAGESAHIGLRGVAKVYGSWRPFIYWAFRRPFGALRQWIGL